MIKSTLAFLVISFIFITKAQIPLINEDIGQQIFHQSKTYLIYVSETSSIEVLLEFQNYCKDKLCTILNSENQIYPHLIEFVGFDGNQFLLILDVPKRLKYCLPVSKNTKAQQIANFYDGFVKGQIEPYYTSEPIPTTQTQRYMTKVVGRTYNQFIHQIQKVRVLFLYTQNELCSNCVDLYKVLEKNAELFSSENIEFGYYDLFKNQNKLLPEEEVPLILIFPLNSKQYKKFDATQIENIQPTLRAQIIKNQEL